MGRAWSFAQAAVLALLVAGAGVPVARAQGTADATERFDRAMEQYVVQLQDLSISRGVSFNTMFACGGYGACNERRLAYRVVQGLVNGNLGSTFRSEEIATRPSAASSSMQLP